MSHRKLVLLVVIVSALSIPARAQSSAPADIFAAAESGDAEAVAGFLKGDPKLVSAANAEGDTALHLAAGCRRGEDAALAVVRLLLEGGAEVDAGNKSRQTPLLYAADAGFVRVAGLLVSRGAVVQYQDASGLSPVHFAALRGNAPVVEFLIGKGADVAAKDGQGRTPLDFAVQRNMTSVVESLVRLGHCDVKGPEGSKILHVAASRGNAGLVKLLLDRGADPSRPSPDGDSLLISYIKGGMASAAVESIAGGADIGARDAAGRTPLHWAVERGLEEAVSALLDRGADPGAADKDGSTALDVARDWDSGPLAARLEAKGARTARNRVYMLKGSSYELVEPPADMKTEEAAIRYVTNDGFLIQAGSRTVIADGFVRNPWGYANTPERALNLMKARLAPFERIDLLLFSHAHLDHFEPRLALDVLAAHPETVLVGDELVLEELRRVDPDAVKALGPRILNPDVKLGERKNRTVNGIPLTILGVNHADREPAYLTLGYIMDLGGFRIYHQGDMYPATNRAFLASVPWEGLKIDIAAFDPFFCGDEWARREVLARIRPSAVILMHLREGEGERYFTELRPAIPQILFFRNSMERKRFVKPAGR